MIQFEIVESAPPPDLSKDEEARFYKKAGTAVRTGAKRLRKAIRDGAPKHAGAYPPSKKGRQPGTLKKAFVYRVKTKKKEGVVEGKVQPKGGIRQKGAQWHIARFLEFGTKHNRAFGFIRRATLQQQSAIEKDLESVAEGD